MFATVPGRRLPLARLTLFAVALLVTVGTVLTAQTTPAPAAGSIEAETGALPTLAQLFQFSPLINGAIAALSVFALAMFLSQLVTITARAMVPTDLVDELTKLVVLGKHDAATDLCRAHRDVFIATIVQRCVENAEKSHSVLMGMIDAEGRRRADLLWNRISYLADVANVAPMLGLLGTVLGMMKAFFLLERQTGSADATALAQGVGQAMSTTMFGLAVAIAALIFYSVIKARTTRVLAEAEQTVHAIADHIKRSQA